MNQPAPCHVAPRQVSRVGPRYSVSARFGQMPECVTMAGEQAVSGLTVCPLSFVAACESAAGEGTMKRAKCLLFSILMILTVNGTVFPQTSSTSVQGAVTDPSGSAIAGATVVLSNSDSKLERAMVTGMQGDYRFFALPPGTYTLTVTAKGFSRYQQTDLQLLVNTPATANVRLKVGSVTESVNVTGEAPALNLVDASIGNPFNETQVKQIPLEG